MIYLFFLFFFISPFIYLQICPLCKKRPQNMLYLTGGYVMIMIFSLFYPDWIKGESLFLYLYLAVLSLEGVLILSWRMKKVKDDYLVSVYARARIVLSGLLAVLLFFIVFQNFSAFSDPQCPDMIILKLPGQDKFVQIEAPGFVLEEKLIASEGDRTRFLASHGKTRMRMAVLLQKRPMEGTAQECRDFFWNKSKPVLLPEEDVRMLQFGDMAIVEYRIEEQKHLYAYLTKGYLWMEIHLSKDDFQPAEIALFKSVLEGIAFSEDIAGQKVSVNYNFSGGKSLFLIFPKTWFDEFQRPPEDRPPTVALSPDYQKTSLIIMMSIIRPGKDIPRLFSSEQIKEMVIRNGEEMLPRAVESELVLSEIYGEATKGYLFWLTDRAPAPGEYRYMCQGATGIGSVILTFTILTNDRESADINEAFWIISSAQQKSKRGDQTE